MNEQHKDQLIEDLHEYVGQAFIAFSSLLSEGKIEQNENGDFIIKHKALHQFDDIFRLHLKYEIYRSLHLRYLEHRTKINKKKDE